VRIGKPLERMTAADWDREARDVADRALAVDDGYREEPEGYGPRRTEDPR
jgi:hypothetical protein